MQTRTIAVSRAVAGALCVLAPLAAQATLPSHDTDSVARVIERWEALTAPVSRSLQDPPAAAPARKQLPPFLIDLTLASGSFDHDTDGSNLDGDTTAGLLRLRFEGYGESRFGGGVEVEVIGSDDDLFVDNGFGESEARAVEVFGYGAYRFESRRFAMPLRFGLFGRRYETEFANPSGEIETTSFGIKVAAEPEIAFVMTEKVRFGAYGNLALGFGVSEIQVSGTSTEWDSNNATLGLELGLRLRVGITAMSLAYLHRTEAIDDSDPEGGVFIRGVDTNFDGVAFTFGFTF